MFKLNLTISKNGSSSINDHNNEQILFAFLKKLNKTIFYEINNLTTGIRLQNSGVCLTLK